MLCSLEFFGTDNSVWIEEALSPKIRKETFCAPQIFTSANTMWVVNEELVEDLKLLQHDSSNGGEKSLQHDNSNGGEDDWDILLDVLSRRVPL